MRRLVLLVCLLLVPFVAHGFDITNGGAQPITLGSTLEPEHMTRVDDFLDAIDDCAATQVLVGAGANTAPACADMSSSLFGQMIGPSLVGVATSTIAVPGVITPALDHQVMRRSGTGIGFGAVNLASSNAVTGILPVANGGIGIGAIGTGVATALGVNTGSAGAFGVVTYRGNGASVDPANSLASGSCNNTDISVTGVATTDTVLWSFDGPVDGVTGFNAAATTGSANIQVYPVANEIRVRTCNPTDASIDPGAFTINWRVIR